MVSLGLICFLFFFNDQRLITRLDQVFPRWFRVLPVGVPNTEYHRIGLRFTRFYRVLPGFPALARMGK